MKTVLVVEDDPDIPIILSKGLDFYQTEMATCVKDACESLQAAHFDLVVLDIGLPDGSGLEVLSRLRAGTLGAALRTLPVVILSAAAEKADVAVGMKLGANAYLTKPFDFVLLRRKIDTLLVLPSHAVP